jgi:hypothetical protein
MPLNKGMCVIHKFSCEKRPPESIRIDSALLVTQEIPLKTRKGRQFRFASLGE